MDIERKADIIELVGVMFGLLTIFLMLFSLAGVMLAYHCIMPLTLFCLLSMFISEVISMQIKIKNNIKIKDNDYI